MRRDWLIEVRKEKGLTQEHVASLSFIDRSFYSQIENGTRDPSISVAKKLAEVLQFNPAAFFSPNLDGLFHAALRSSPVTIGHFDVQLKYTWIFNSHKQYMNDEIIGKTDIQIADNEGTRDLMSMKKDIVWDGKKIRRQITFPLSSGFLTYDIFGHPLFKNRKIIGGTTVSTDITYLIQQQHLKSGK